MPANERPKLSWRLAERARIDRMLEHATNAMRARLYAKIDEGKTGWDTPVTHQQIQDRLLVEAAALIHGGTAYVNMACRAAILLWQKDQFEPAEIRKAKW